MSDPPASDAVLLRRFMADALYGRDFMSPNRWGTCEGWHGPFLSRRLRPEWYRPIAREMVRRDLYYELDFWQRDTMDDEPGDMPASDRMVPVEEWLATVEAGEGPPVYVLDPPAQADLQHDIAFILWLFREYVQISPDRTELTVRVFGLD